MKKNMRNVCLTAIALLALAPAVTTSVATADNSSNTASSVNSTSIGSSAVSSESAFVTQYIHDGKTESIDLNNKTVQVAINSKFNPTNITLSDGSTIKVSGTNSSKVTVDSNSVDTSKPGTYYTVKLSSNNKIISYTVFVKPRGIYQLNMYLYSSYPFKMDESGKIMGEDVNFYQGEKYYIGNRINYWDGRFYTTVSKKSEEDADDTSHPTYWIEISDLANPILKVEEKMVMHRALVYSRGGGSKYRHYNAFETVLVNTSQPEYIDGVKYYQVFSIDNGSTEGLSDFIKAANIDGTKRTLTKNAYVYATSKCRSSNEVLKKGIKIITYGGSYKFKNGKRYYRIQGATKTNKRYVKVANFK